MRSMLRALGDRNLRRHFRLEFALVVAYTTFTIALWIFSGFVLYQAVYLISAFILLLAPIFRSISSYRIGFSMGIQAFPLAMAQPTPERAEALIARSSELWDPIPLEVAHQLEIEQLEKDVNGGSARG